MIKLLLYRATLLFTVCSLLSTYSCSNEYRVKGNSIFFQGTRIQVLTPTLFRIETGLVNQFKNETDLGVVNLDFAKVKFSIIPKIDHYEIETDSSILIYYPNLAITNGGIQVEGKNNKVNISSLLATDTTNLGGVVGSIDNCLGNRRFGGEKQNDVGGEWHYMPEFSGILSKRGWTVMDWKTDTLKVMQPENPGNDLFVMIYGKNYKSALNDFYQLAGRIPMLPKWSLGLIYSRWKDYSDKDLEDIVLEFRKRDIPLDAIIADMSWHIDGWYGYRYDTINFPDMNAYHRWTDSMHIKTGFNHHSGSIYAFDPRIEEFCERIGVDYNAAVTDGPSWLPGEKVVSYNPNDSLQFNTFYQMYADQLLKDGVDFHWVDGERTIHSSHNYYENTRGSTGKRPIVLNRLNEITMCNHRYPVGFSGDTYIGWETLEYSLEVTLKSANNGVYWSHDIGGYMPQGPSGYEPTDELFARWLQMGAFSPIFRLHAKKPVYWTPKVEEGDFDPGSRLIWEWGKTVESVGKESIQLRYKLLPYLYTLAHIAHESGVPMIAPMYIHYPHDGDAYGYSQFMVGENILVAPFLSPSGNGIEGITKRTFWLPEGIWYDYFTGGKITGPCTMEVEKDIYEFPVYIKAGSILPEFSNIQNTEQNPDELTVEIYAASKAGKVNSFSLYEDDGISYDYEQGVLRETMFYYTQNETGSQILIKSPAGKYTNGLDSRYYKLVLNDFTGANEVVVNGSAIEKGDPLPGESYWSVIEGKTIISLKGFPANKNIDVEIVN